MSQQAWMETLVSQQVDGTANTAGTAASIIAAAAKITLPANYFYIGRELHFILSGRISTVITAPGTARFDIRLGGTVVWDSQAIALDTAVAYTNVSWRLDVILTCRAIGNGTATTFMGAGGTWSSPNIAGAPATPPKGALTAMLPWNTAPAVGTGIDCTTTQTVDVFFTQTVATGSCTCHQYRLKSLN